MPSQLQRRREAQADRLDRYCREALTRSRKRQRNRRDLLLNALQNQVVGEAGLPRYLDEAVVAFLSCDSQVERDAFYELVLRVEAVADRLLVAGGALGGNRYLAGLQGLASQRSHWKRDVNAWKPTSKSPGRQFSQLARYLLADYPVPDFLDEVFFTPPVRVDPSWFWHVGSGHNLRTAPRLPVKLTKRMAHHCLLAPEDADLIKAIRWGQVLGLGGSPRLARAVWGTRLGWHLGRPSVEAFWTTVLHWFAQQPMLDPAQVGPILDFVTHRWWQDRSFSMNGRTPAALLRLAEGWHAEQNQIACKRVEKTDRDLPASGIEGGIWEVGRGANATVWTVEEILSVRALVAEGVQMRHCVATYEESVQAGWCSIWTMRSTRFGVLEPAVTIEVRNRHRAIVQVRGKCNRCPTQEEQRILERWARENSLTIAL